MMAETTIEQARAGSGGMRLLGIVLLFVGAGTMLGALLYSPYDRFTELERLTQVIECNNQRAQRGDYSMSCERQPLQVHNPQRAKMRELMFMGGGAILILGGIFAAAGGRRRA